MKRTGFRRRQLRERPIAWRETEPSALRDHAATSLDDRASDDNFYYEDEYAEVDAIIHGMTRESN